jgi:hypothetical protein
VPPQAADAFGPVPGLVHGPSAVSGGSPDRLRAKLTASRANCSRFRWKSGGGGAVGRTGAGAAVRRAIKARVPWISVSRCQALGRRDWDRSSVMSA